MPFNSTFAPLLEVVHSLKSFRGNPLGAAPKRRSPRRLVTTIASSACAASTSGRRLVEETDRLNRLRHGGGGRKGPSGEVLASSTAPTKSSSSSSSSLVWTVESREKVDIVRLLAERDMWWALDRVLEHLQPPDLCAFSLVCQVRQSVWIRRRNPVAFSSLYAF